MLNGGGGVFCAKADDGGDDEVTKEGREKTGKGPHGSSFDGC